MRALADLHAYQERAITELYERDCLQLVIPMGGGKSVIAMTAVAELLRDKEIRCGLVMAPKRVANTVWPHEAVEWMHLIHLRVVTLRGTPAQRRKLLDAPADLYVCSIDNMTWMVSILASLPKDHPIFDLLIIDELSRFKNPKSQRAKKLFRLVSRFKIFWGMTGTPRPNSLLDQFGPLKLLSNARIWGRSFYKWRAEHFFPLDYNEYNWEVRPDHEAGLLNDISRLTFTVDPADVPSVEAHLDKIYVELPPRARAAYNKMRSSMITELADGRYVIAASAENASGKLEQIAQGFVYNDGKVAETFHTAKLEALKELVEGAAGGEPLLIGYHFREDLAVLRDYFDDLPYLGAGVNDAKADKWIAEWNVGNLPVMAVHPASAGHGLNMQAGGHRLALFALPWSAEMYDQLIKRLARQGQQNASGVFVHHIIARDTVDEAKFARVHGKMSRQEAFINHLLKSTEGGS